MVQDCWTPYNSTLLESHPIQFHSNIKKIKIASVKWAKDKKEQEDKALIKIKIQHEN
jgi:hypothetical protein